MFIKIFILAVVVALAAGHGHMKRRLSRTSIFTDPVFNPVHNPPYWYNHEGVWCDNVLQDTRYSSCGRCGDKLGETDANQGGIYDKGVIVATYNAGAVIEVEGVISAAHYGHFEVELCPQVTETDSCFQKLTIVGGTEEVRDGNRICIPSGGSAVVTARVQLPSGIRCERCTLRWTYRSSYPPHGEQYGRDFCDNWQPTQTFRNCADIKIV